MEKIQDSVIDLMCEAIEKQHMNIADAVKKFTKWQRTAAFYKSITGEQLTRLRQAKATLAAKTTVYAKGSPRMKSRKYTPNNNTQLPYGPTEGYDEDDDIY